MIRIATNLLPLLTLVAGCAGPAPVGDGQTNRQAANITAACRQQAERAVLYRDRGQVMRNDSAEVRTGTPGEYYPSVRAENDRLAATFERDRLARECVRDTSPTGEAAAPGR